MPPKPLIGGANIPLTSSTPASLVRLQLAIGVATPTIGPPRRTMLTFRMVWRRVVLTSIRVRLSSVSTAASLLGA